ncbi:AI-2E family transporter [Wenxinia marina]|uniref:Putative permease n=1 Tax=Wenxinia marina DSM 24838 TaxID=1123501 RepID=A0A0D0QFA6_9RHOB|nr:AI-2E family transporter [Wenxinia marina]KIQ69668.1 putative permease [Wenxinia marina DSM 24838]GGL60180.1 AI-2E family transporter [Wenxinia marina]
MSEDRSLGAFTVRVAIAAAALAAVGLLWVLRHPIALIFLAVVIAVALDGLSRPFRKVGLSRGWSVSVALVLIVALLVTGGWLAMPTLREQASDLMEMLPMSLDTLARRMDDRLASALGQVAEMAGRLLSWSMTLFGGLTTALLVTMTGAFLAISPGRYRDGLVRLFPTDAQPRLRDTFDAIGRRLGLWLRAKLMTMAIVGVGTGLGVWWIGLPAPLILGTIAALFEFVPVIGPIAAALPALVMALSQGTGPFLWTLALYVGVQQVESNMILPALEGRVAEIPPALLIVAFALTGSVLGLVGVVITAPLTIALMTMVQRLWLHEDAG